MTHLRLSSSRTMMIPETEKIAKAAGAKHPSTLSIGCSNQGQERMANRQPTHDDITAGRKFIPRHVLGSSERGNARAEDESNANRTEEDNRPHLAGRAFFSGSFHHDTSIVTVRQEPSVASLGQLSHTFMGFMGDSARLANLAPEAFDLVPQLSAALDRGLILVIGHEAMNLTRIGMFRAEHGQSGNDADCSTSGPASTSYRRKSQTTTTMIPETEKSANIVGATYSYEPNTVCSDLGQERHAIHMPMYKRITLLGPEIQVSLSPDLATEAAC